MNENQLTGPIKIQKGFNFVGLGQFIPCVPFLCYASQFAETSKLHKRMMIERDEKGRTCCETIIKIV